MQAIRLAFGLLVLAASIAGCSSRTNTARPAALPPTPGVAAPAAPASTPLHLALQTLPPGSVAYWGGGGRAVALVGPGCDVALVDLAQGVITAHVQACSVWPSPTEDVFLARMRDGMMGVWDGHGTRQGLLAADDRAGEAPVWSPDGRRVALLFPRGIVIRSADDWGEVQHVVLDGDSGALHWIGAEGSFRADGSQLVVADGGQVLLADLQGSGRLSPLPTACPQVHEASFAPRGDSLAVECAGGHDAEIWDTRVPRLVATVPHFAAWDPTGRRVVGRDGTHLDVHDASTGRRVLRVDAHTWDRFALPPDGERIAIEASDGNTRALVVQEVDSGREIARMADRLAPAWSADGRFLSATGASAGDADRVVFETASWREVWRRGHASHLAWSPGGGQLAVTGDTPSVRLDDLETGRTRTLDAAFPLPFTETTIDAAGDLVARLAGSEECRALRVDAQGSTSLLPVPCADPFETVSPDGTKRTRFTRTRVSMMAMGTWQLYVDDTSSGEHAFVDHGWMMNPLLVWSRRGHRLLVVQGRALLFEVDGRRAWAVRVDGAVRAAALDAEGSRAALSMMDGRLLVVRPTSHDAAIVLRGACKEPEQAALLAFEGERLAAVTVHGDVSIWDVVAQAPVAQWHAGFDPEHVALTADGQLLAMSRGDALHLARVDGSGALTLTPFSAGGATTFVVNDGAGHVDGPAEALALVRWQSTGTGGEPRWLDAHETDPSPLRPGLLASLVGGP